MNADEFDSVFRERLNALATSNLSDACDRVGIPRCAVQGIVPRWGRTKVVGRAVTQGIEIEAKFRLDQMIDGLKKAEQQ